MLPACAIACMAEVLQLGSTNYDAKVALYTLSTILFIVIFTSFIFMVMEFTHIANPYKLRTFAPFLLVPVIASVAVITDPWFHLFNGSDIVVNNQAISGPLLTVSPSVIGLLWIAYFDVIGTIFATLLFLYLYRADYKRPAIVFLGGVILIHSYVIASYFIQI